MIDFNSLPIGVYENILAVVLCNKGEIETHKIFKELQMSKIRIDIYFVKYSNLYSFML